MTVLSAVLCLLVFQQSLPGNDADGAKPAASEQSVLAAYQKMQEADRKGDAELWFSLRDKKTLDTMNPAVKAAIRKGGRSRPGVRYEPGLVRVRSDRAVLIGKVTDPAAGTTQFQSVVFVIENGAWKVSREQWSETAIDPFVLFGLLPPDSGAFLLAGAPWKRVPYAVINTEVVGKKDVMWKMQATYDESFVYLRYEWFAEIPQPGSKVKPELAASGKTGGPPAPPPMQIKIRGAGPEFESGQHDLTVSVNDVVSTSASGQSTVNYSMSIKNAAGEDAFEYSIGNDSAGRLLGVQDRFVDLRIPLGGLGVTDAAKAKVQLEEAGSVLHILPYTAERFSGK
jgi:hypothetical protein